MGDHGQKQVLILPPQDVIETLSAVQGPITTTILDPWYNRGVGGRRDGYAEWLTDVVVRAGAISKHVFVWGFPEIVHELLNQTVLSRLDFVAWLTWYYKNCPSVIRGWRSSQYSCLHFRQPGATLFPEHFLNEAQKTKDKQGKLRYMPGPGSVIEVPLNIGFVGRDEQTGHPAQKPEKVFEPLILMTTEPDDVVLDPFCGSGTTGVVCSRLGRKAVLCDSSDEYLRLAEQRLKQRRERDGHFPKNFLKNSKTSLFSRAGADWTIA